jgi:hypothetical protein
VYVDTITIKLGNMFWLSVDSEKKKQLLNKQRRAGQH